MIQRIQTLYLLVVTAFMTCALLLPIAEFTAADGTIFTLSAFSLSSDAESMTTLWMAILMVLSTALPFITIFLFKRRQLQVRMCAAEIVLLLGCIAFILIYYFLSGSNALESVDIVHKQFSWAAIMPVASIILSFLAARAIFKDEVLVRSLDRIR